MIEPGFRFFRERVDKHFLVSYPASVHNWGEDWQIMSKQAEKLTAKEIAYVRQMAKYEDKWVAILKSKGMEKVVGSGDTILDAKRDADEKGVKNPTFRKIPSTRKILIASTNA